MNTILNGSSDHQLTRIFIEKFWYPPDKKDKLYRTCKQSGRFIQNLQIVEEQWFSNPEFDKEQFAEKMQMSKSTLQRKMRTITGLTPLQYIRSVQYVTAFDLLSNSKMNIKRIAHSIGFSDPKYFSRCFRIDFGITPQEYRTHIRQQKN
jgi:AraC-like DNA-binding protein